MRKYSIKYFAHFHQLPNNLVIGLEVCAKKNIFWLLIHTSQNRKDKKEMHDET